MVTLSAGESAVEVTAVRLADGRYGAALPDGVPWLVDGGAVTVVVPDDDTDGTGRPAVLSMVRSGRAWTEVRGRLREELGPLRRRLHRPPEVVALLALHS